MRAVESRTNYDVLFHCTTTLRLQTNTLQTTVFMANGITTDGLEAA